MPAFLGLGTDNPIAWSNFYRKGGFRSAIGTSSAYFGIIGALIFLSARLNQRDASSSYSAWTNILLGLQLVFLVIIGAGRVTGTIRSDISSGMIESLRMMPLPGRHAIAGYMTSSAATLSGFFIANFVLGLIVNTLSELPAERWLAANGILLIFAIFVWTIAAFMAFLSKGAGGFLVLISIIGIFGNAALLYVAPGLIVLAGPLVGGSIFDPRSSQTEFAAPLAISIAAQFLVGAILFAGASRKFRRPDALALGAWLGLALLLSFIGISLLALLKTESFQPRFLARAFRDSDPEVPFCGSTILVLLFSLIPLANFARLHVNWVKGRIDDPQLKRSVPPPAIAAVIVAAALALMLLALPTPPGKTRAVCMAAAFWGFSLSVIFVAAWFYRAVDNAKVIISIWLIAYCFLPLGLDFARDRLTNGDEPTMTMASSFSPVGLIIEATNESKVNLRPAAVFHVLIPWLPVALYLRGRRPKPQGG